MSLLKDLYVGFGHSSDDLKNNGWYLSLLFLKCSVELNYYSGGYDSSRDHLREFLRILDDSQLYDEKDFTKSSFPYEEICSAIKTISNKKLSCGSEFLVEMRLLRYELSDVLNGSGNTDTKGLQFFFRELGKELSKNKVLEVSERH
jgi:hypothetical protein